MIIKQGRQPAGEFNAAHNAFRYTFNVIASIAGAFAFRCVSCLNLLRTMPIIAVYLDQQVRRRHVQVEHVTSNFVFSDHLNPLSFKGGAYHTFGDCLTNKTAIASERTERAACRVVYSGRHNAVRFMTRWAFNYNRRATALLGAIMTYPVFGMPKSFAASFAGGPRHNSPFAFHRADVVPVSGRGGYAVFLAAYRASLGDAPIADAFKRTIFLFGFLGVELFAALRANAGRVVGAFSRVVLPSAQGAASLTQRTLFCLWPSGIHRDVALFTASSTDNNAKRFHVISQTKTPPFLTCTRCLDDTEKRRGRAKDSTSHEGMQVRLTVSSRQLHCSTDGLKLQGSVCLGRGRCRCTRRAEYNPAVWRRLMGRD